MKRKLIISALLLLCSVFTFAQQSDTLRAERKVNYMALVLDSLSTERLKSFALEKMPWSDNKVYCHHMTIAHYTNLTDSIASWVREHESQTFTIQAIEYGHSDKAFAVKVDPNGIPSANTLTHVTMATNNATGGKAVDSNYITSWTSLPSSITLTGKVEIIYFDTRK